MSDLSGFLGSGGGGGGAPVNTIARLYVGGEVLYTDEAGGVWLKTGNVIASDPTTYPDAFYSPNIASASFTQSFSVGSEEATPQGIAFNTDGTKMFVVGSTGDAVNEYALSTAFDISTATYTTNFSLVAQDGAPTGIVFNNDGAKMFITGVGNDNVYEYSLATAFDVSTASFTQSFSVAAQENAPRDLTFNNDGTKMFIVGYGFGPNVYVYDLSTAFDVSTASYTTNLSVVAQETSPQAIAFNNDGSSMFILGMTEYRVKEYKFEVPFDVTTAYYSGTSFYVYSQETAPAGITFNNDGAKMFVVGYTGDNVYEYSVPIIMGLTTDTGTYDYIKLK